MNSRQRVIRTLNHKEVDRFPRDLWTLPGISMFKKDQLEEMNKLFESDFGSPSLTFGVSRYTKGTPNVVGKYIDEFGCKWHVGEPGVIGEVREPLIKEWTDLKNYEMPWEILNEMDLSKVDESCKNSDKFMLCGTHVRPFERMQFMRGTENLFLDLAMGEEGVYELANILHEFYCREISVIAETKVDGISFIDDWGTQVALLISPQIWRKIFKPMYKDYVDIIHSKGKYAFFHSDGNIEAIYPELVEIGIDAINSQLFCMNLEKIIDQYGDKITLWGEIDRQGVLPYGNKEDINAAVDRVYNAVFKKNGKRTGAIAQCEWGMDVSFENIAAVFERWNQK